MLYVVWKRGLLRKCAHFVLFRPIKKRSFDFLCVLDPYRFQSTMTTSFFLPNFTMDWHLTLQPSWASQPADLMYPYPYQGLKLSRIIPQNIDSRLTLQPSSASQQTWCTHTPTKAWDLPELYHQTLTHMWPCSHLVQTCFILTFTKKSETLVYHKTATHI